MQEEETYNIENFGVFSLVTVSNIGNNICKTLSEMQKLQKKDKLLFFVFNKFFENLQPHLFFMLKKNKKVQRLRIFDSSLFKNSLALKKL
jgi:hypothetical protein